MRRRYRTPGAPVLVSIVACIAIAACQNAFGKFENPIDSLSTKYTGVPTVDTPDKIEAAKEADLSDGTNVRLTATTVFGATDYSVQVSRTANFADADILKAAMQPTNIFSIKLSDLAAGTLYWRVAAKKGGSLGPYSPAKSFVVAGSAADTVAPANVTELTAAAGNGQVTLSWTEPGDADFAGVEISAPGITAQTVAKGTAIKLINGLTNGNAYTFTVKAYDTANNKAGGATATATPAVGVIADTTAPANVTNLTATSGDGQVTLSWTEPSDTDFAGVEISATGITTITVGKGTTVKVFNGLTNGNAYTFTVKAYDTANNKASGVTASGTPTVVTVAVSAVSVAPTTLSLTVGGATGTLTATVAPTDASNKFVTWSSGDATIATVSSGVVTPVKAGTVTISAASVADGTKKGSCVVTVGTGTVPLGWTRVASDSGMGSQFYVTTLAYNSKMWLFGNGIWNSPDGVTWTSVKTGTASVATVHNNKLWAIDGNAVSCSSDGISWIQVDSSPATFSARRWEAFFSFGGKLWIAGGQNTSNSTWYNDVWRSSDGVTWDRATADAGFASAGGSPACIVWNGKIWAIGSSSVLSSVDGITWTVENSSPAFPQRMDTGLVEYNSELWLVAGCRDGSTVYNDIWKSSDGKTWVSVSTNAQFSERYGHGTVTFNNAIWVVCGTGYGGTKTDVWSFSTEPSVAVSGVTMVQVPTGSGKFHQGYTVTVTAFRMSTYEITQGQYYAVTGSAPSAFCRGFKPSGRESDLV